MWLLCWCFDEACQKILCRVQLLLASHMLLFECKDNFWGAGDVGHSRPLQLSFFCVELTA